MKKFFLLSVLMLLPLLASADAVEIDGIYYNLSEEIAEVTENPNNSNYPWVGGYSGNIVIPESVMYDGKSYSVTSIGEEAFDDCSGLTSVTIPNSVISIGDRAFAGCSGLTTITIPNSVTSIGYGTFSYCEGLKSITIPNSVTSIDNGAFSNCKGLTSITIPNSVTSIESAFQDCTSLTSIKVESGNPKYDSRNECNAIIETSSNTLIAGCKTTIIPNSVTSIGEEAFWGCSGLITITIPNSVTSIGNDAFVGCSGLTSMNIPSSVTSIGFQAFDYCIGLTSVTIPNSVTFIDNSAFRGCKGLTSITIPNSVTSIDGNPFAECSGLTSIKVESDNPQYESPNDCNAILEKEYDFFTDTYSYDLIAGCKTTIIPNSVTSIKSDAFRGCSGLTSITIPNSVTFIGESAFLGCKGLTSIIIPNNVTSIGSYAFGGCSSLTDVCSMIQQPFAIDESVFRIGFSKFTTATLYVPSGTKEKYMATDGWKKFQNIVEMQAEMNPIDSETTVKTDQLNGQDLSDNVVGDVYYNVGNDGYDATDQSIVISETTNMGQITNAVPGSADVKENFTGIILKVAKGKGVITVNAKTSGNAQLVVQVGNGTPMIASKSVKGDVEVSYDVEEDTYVYIYAILGSSAARATRASSDGEVRIYGITIRPGATGISSIVKDNNTDAPIYNLSGQRLSVPRKGINIINGKKVVVK